MAELDADDNVVKRFVYGTRPDVPDYMLQGGDTYRIVSDQLGSVRLVVNVETGIVRQRLDYDAFGRVIQNTSPDFQPFGYAGGIYDHRTGLVRFGARDYDPETGKWTSKDPALFGGGDPNLYAYALGDPVNLHDPAGRRVDLAGHVFTNPAVVENLFKLNAAIMQLYCLEDDEFVIRVTGGDRYIDCAGNHVSLTTGKIVPNSSSTSPHLIERGARGVDFKISGTTLTPEQIDLALAQTEFTPGNTKKDPMTMAIRISRWRQYPVGLVTRAFQTSVLRCCYRCSLSCFETMATGTRRTRMNHSNLSGERSNSRQSTKLASAIPGSLGASLVAILLCLLNFTDVKAQGLPTDLSAIASQHDCQAVENWLRDRPGMTDPAYLYGYYPRERELSAAFWCRKLENRRTYLLVLWNWNYPDTTPDGCPSFVEWREFPRGLSLFEDEDMSLNGFRYIDDRTEVSPEARTGYRPLRAEYDGNETLFYCHEGRWTYRTRH